MITHTISYVELAWTVAAAIGLLYSLRLLNRAIGDLNFLKREQVNGIREFSAVTVIWIFTLMSVVEFAFLFVGLAAMTFQSPRDHIQPASYVIATVFIMVGFVFAVLARVIDKRKEFLLDKFKRDMTDDIA